MADFTTGSDTLNNPQNWFPSVYTYDNINDITTLDLTGALAGLGPSGTVVTDADLHALTGDARAVYLVLADFLYSAYRSKSYSADTSSNRLKMTKSSAVDETNSIRYTTYTIHVQEDGQTVGGTARTAPSFISSGVRAE